MSVDERNRVHQRARQRALRRLQRLHEQEFRVLIEEERAKAGIPRQIHVAREVIEQTRLQLLKDKEAMSG